MKEIKGVRYSDNLNEVIGYNPETISSHVVILPCATEIADEAFKNLGTLETINLSNIKKIRNSAFKDCINLSRVVSTHNLKSIGHCAFLRCKSLRHIELHEGLERVTDGAFRFTGVKVLDLPSTVVLGNEDMYHGVTPQFDKSGQVGLETVIMNAEQFGDGNAFVAPYPYIIFRDANGEDTSERVWTEDGAVFTENSEGQKELLRLPHDRDIPYGTEALGEYCLSTDNDYIYLPGTIQEIDESAFAECPHLRTFFVSSESYKFLCPLLYDIDEDYIVERYTATNGTVEDYTNEFERAYVKNLISESKLSQDLIQKMKDSKSYVLFECASDCRAEDIDPLEMSIQLRDANKTIVQLNPGFNVVTVEDYPGLKYGFKSNAEDSDCCLITRIYLNHFDSKEVTDMSDMFSYMDALTYIDFSGFDTSKVKDMSGTFHWCSELHAADLSGFNTSNVERMDYMFYNCDVYSLDLSRFDMRKVNDIDQMFCSCCGRIDISNWDLNPAVKGDVFGDTPFSDYECFVMKNVKDFTREYFERIFDECDDEPNIIR